VPVTFWCVDLPLPLLCSRRLPLPFLSFLEMAAPLQLLQLPKFTAPTDVVIGHSTTLLQCMLGKMRVCCSVLQCMLRKMATTMEFVGSYSTCCAHCRSRTLLKSRNFRESGRSIAVSEIAFLLLEVSSCVNNTAL